MLTTPKRRIVPAVVLGFCLWAQASPARAAFWHFDREVAAQLHVDVVELNNKLGIDLASEAEWWAKFLRTCENLGQTLGECSLQARTLGEQQAWADDTNNALLQNAYALRLESSRIDGAPTQESLGYLLKAAEAGEPHAQVTLGWYCLHGIGLPRNMAAAYRWNRLGALQGHPEGANNLGFQYEYGLGVKKNLEKARDWYRYAAIRGSLIGLATLLQMEKGNDAGEGDDIKDSEQLTGIRRSPHSAFHRLPAHAEGSGRPSP
jgi:hypothetical protein